MKIADFWKKCAGETSDVQCDLCPHNCIIKNGKKGFCGVRQNIDGKLFALNYFLASSSNLDPIEKKPLYHFLPGSSIYSLGTYGCNFSCKFCQNYSISKEFPASRLGAPNFTKEEIIEILKRGAHEKSFAGLAYTYNEPTIWAETILELAPEVKKLGLKNVFVTNGFISPKPLETFLEFGDAFNIDLKSFNGNFYKNICGGSLKPVLETIKTVSEKAHLELTTLVIPGLNDSKEDFENLREWIVDNAGENVPVHLSKYYPTYKLNLPGTPIGTLNKARDILRKKINYVYIGNVGGEQNTYCPKCGELLIRRTGYSTEMLSLDADGKCEKCGLAVIETMRR